MTRSVAEKRSAFRTLHEKGCFVIPNPWDLGSARMLQHLGFEALASTSSGFAWTRGRPDYDVTKSDVLAHLRELCAGVDLPVNADFEGGFANDPDHVEENVALAVGTGVAGLSIEDKKLGGTELFDLPQAVDRIRAARRAIDATGQDVLLVARAECMLYEPKSLGAAIDKLVAFAEAGADVLFAPGVREKDDIAAMVKAVAPKPLNVLVMKPGITVAELADLGVRRVSVGGALARVAWAAVMAAAEQMKNGSFDLLATTPSKPLNEMFQSTRT